MFKVSRLCVNTSSQTLSQLADSRVNNVLLQSASDINQSLFDFNTHRLVDLIIVLY